MDANSTSTLQKERPAVAAPEMCGAIQAGTGWDNTFFNYWKSHIGSSGQWILSWYGNTETREVKERLPAYDTAYLLTKIPASIKKSEEEIYLLSIHPNYSGISWQVHYRNIESQEVLYVVYAKTLVEALASITLELISAGIIGKVEL